ncbi:hypothetical protein Tco_0212202 [Tanacetum coccineum]
MIHPETTSGTNKTTLHKAECRQSLHIGDRRKKGSLMGVPAQAANSAISTTLADAPKGAIRAMGNSQWKCCLSVEHQVTSERLSKTEEINGCEEMGMHIGWVYAVGTQKSGIKHQKPDEIVVQENVTCGYVCDEKLVQVPYGNETLTFCGNESSNGRESRLTVISCSKAQEYMAKGCQVFLASDYTPRKVEDSRSERKQIEDVPIVRDFPEVFPEDLPGLPPARPVEFQIDLIPGATPVARAPYRLAPSEMKELSDSNFTRAF